MGQLEQLQQAVRNGIEYREEVDLSPWHGPVLLVRPLTTPEVARYEQIKTGWLSTSIEVREDREVVQGRNVAVDLETYAGKRGEARIYAVACGLSHSGEECSPDLVRQFPDAWNRALERAILQISGVSDPETPFRPASGGRAGPAAGRPGPHGGDGAAATEPGGSARR